ncbi:MAG: hypothetical protein QOE90_164 [Thermoplasmata archaeon]|jgi:uncharacterized protein YndB with AHSA1/START domain|nr:hypothetical protein [Thermoplasmata archaeon]
MVKSPSEALLLQRRLPVPPEKVFDAFTDPARLARWFAPMDDWRTVVHELDAREGGRYRVDMVPPTGPPNRLHGTYTQLRRPDLLVFTWRWEGSPEETIVRIELTPIRGGCEMLLTHELFAGPDSTKQHAEGWEGCLARLPAALEG